MTILNLSILEKEKTDIKNVLFSPSQYSNLVPEIEIRFGFMKLDKTKNKNFFVANNDYYNVWLKAYNNVSSSKYNNVKETKDIVYSKGDFRKIVSENETIAAPSGSESPSAPNRKVIFMKKLKSSENNVDINIINSFGMRKIKSEGTDFKKELYTSNISTIRIAKAYEIDSSENEFNNSKQPVKEFKRHRITYLFDTFQIDFTVREDESTGKKYTNYEIEIEFTSEIISKILNSKSDRDFFNEMKKSLSLIYPSIHTLFIESSYNNIISDINNIIVKYPKEKKPRNIKEEDVETIVKNIVQTNNTESGTGNRISDAPSNKVASVPATNLGYYVTNKLDGIGYNLLFQQEKILNQKGESISFISVFLCNKKDIFKVSLIPESKIKIGKSNIGAFLNSLSKCEVRFIGEKIEVHFFDCLIFYDSNNFIGNDKLYQQNFKNRLDALNVINNFCKLNFETPNLTFTIKTFFKSESIVDDIKKTFNYMYETFGEDLIEYNDGIIIQPDGNFEDYYPMKWKFPSKVSIDFTLQFFSSNEKTTTYKLLSVFEGGELNQFVDEYTNTSHFITVNNDEVYDNLYGNKLDNVVVECGKSLPSGIENDEFFSIMRIRYDKSYKDSNFIDVANNTIYDMINEMTINDLINMINNNLTKQMNKELNESKIDIQQVILKFEQPQIMDNEVGGDDLNTEFKKMKIEETKENQIIQIPEITIYDKSIYYQYEKLNKLLLSLPYNSLLKSGIVKFIRSSDTLQPEVEPMDEISIGTREKEIPSPARISEIPETSRIPETAKKLVNFRKYHNEIKRKLILDNLTNENMIVVDLGSGKGGDLPKYLKAKFKKLYMIEPNKENLKELKERFRQKEYSSLRNKIEIIESKAENLDLINKITQKADVVFMFYSLTFFFKNRELLQDLASVISGLLKEGGKLVATYMNGDKVFSNLLKGDIISNSYTIKSINLDINASNYYGKEIEIDFKETATATKQLEYLIRDIELSHILSYKDLYLIDIQDTETIGSREIYSKFTLEEKKLASFYSQIEFIKEKNKRVENIDLNLCVAGRFPYILDEYYYREVSSSFTTTVLRCLQSENQTLEEIDGKKFTENIFSNFTIDRYLKEASSDLENFFKNVFKIEFLEDISKESKKELIINIGGGDSESLKTFFESINWKIPNQLDTVIKRMTKNFIQEDIIKVEKLFNEIVYYLKSEFENNISLSFLVKYIEELLYINIIVIDSETKKINRDFNSFNKDKLCIIIYNIEDKYFEPLYKMIKKNGEYIRQKVFVFNELTNMFFN
jgi:hypothetical protein